MSNEQKQPQEGKSPGEMINEYMKSHKDELYLNDCKKLMEQYAAQQTTALREELHQAQQEIIRLKNLNLGPLITQGDKAIKTIQKQSKLADELKAVKKERDALKNAIIRGERLSDSLQFEGEGPSIKQQLMAMKKERDELDKSVQYERKVAYETSKKNADVIIQLSEVTRQRDEAVKLLHFIEEDFCKWRMFKDKTPRKELESFLSRLSSEGKK